jgi:multiple sugar transport system ATP-binding protein
MAKVLIERMNKYFGAVKAVEDLTIELQESEFLVLLGPSGCGKTTTLEIVAGLQKQSSGHIYIGGELVDTVPPKDRDVAVVFQSYALYPHMTVFDNMAFPLKLRRRRKDEIVRAVKEAAQLLGLSELLDRKPKELSGGQMQRAALGRAIVRQPKVFLMDEPLSNLDAKLRMQTRGELKRLQRELGVTTLYVTHDQVEAMTMGDRVAVLNGGRLQQLGSPEEIYIHPANTFVAGFIGSPSMNFLPCHYRWEDGRPLLDLGEFNLELSTELARRLTEKTVPERLILGLRPKHVLVHREPVPEAVVAELQLLQPLGSEVIAILKVGEKTFTAEAFSGWLVEEGFRAIGKGTVWVTFEEGKLHLFDAQSEKALL